LYVQANDNLNEMINQSVSQYQSQLQSRQYLEDNDFFYEIDSNMKKK